jgi:hypothetical protein
LLTPETRLYTQYTHRHPGVASSNAMGEVTDVRVNKRELRPKTCVPFTSSSRFSVTRSTTIYSSSIRPVELSSVR